MQKTTKSDLSRHYLPRQLRILILQEFLIYHTDLGG